MALLREQVATQNTKISQLETTVSQQDRANKDLEHRLVAARAEAVQKEEELTAGRRKPTLKDVGFALFLNKESGQ